MKSMYCPECASGNVRQQNSRDQQELWICNECGTVDDVSAFDLDWGPCEDEGYNRDQDIYGKEDVMYGRFG